MKNFETMNPVTQHKELCTELNILYEKKNSDYGDSFHKTFLEEGYAMARVRLDDKLNRFKELSRKSGTDAKVTDESIRDTLVDLANYALMTVMELDRANEAAKPNVSVGPDDKKSCVECKNAGSEKPDEPTEEDMLTLSDFFSHLIPFLAGDDTCNEDKGNGNEKEADTNKPCVKGAYIDVNLCDFIDWLATKMVAANTKETKKADQKEDRDTDKDSEKGARRLSFSEWMDLVESGFLDDLGELLDYV